MSIRTRWRVASAAASAAVLGVVVFHDAEPPRPTTAGALHPAASAQLVTVNAPRSAYQPRKLQAAVRRSKALAVKPPVDDRAKDRFRPGQIAVEFEKRTSDADRAAIRARYGVKTFEAPFGGVERWHLTDRGTEAEMAHKVAAEPGVELAIPNRVIELAGAPNDPSFNDQWSLARTSENYGIDAVQGWDATDAAVTSPVTVAVVDSGVQLDHPDLVNQLWTNRGEFGPDGQGGLKQTNGRDDDFNGIRDDVHGLNVASPDAPPNPGPAVQDGHGTHVAGIIAAERGNGQGVAGVSKQARIMAVRVAVSDDVAVRAGVEYAISEGATIVNGSFAAEASSPNVGLLASLVQSHPEVLFVFGAGNDQTELGTDRFSYPCSIPSSNVICVGATDEDGQQAADQNAAGWRGSNFGPSEVDISAPGVSILSTLPGSTYGRAGGTSMATPVVTGAAAVLKSKQPSLTPAQIRERLMRTADPVPSPLASASGRVNLRNAVTDAISARPARGTANVYVSGNVLVYNAAPGAPNGVALRRMGSTSSFTVSDPASALTAGAGCSVASAHSVTCTGVTAGLINTGDGNDAVDALVSIPLIIDTGNGTAFIRTGSADDSITTGAGNTYINSGAGNDSLTLGDGFNEVWTQAGADTVIGGPGIDKLDLGDGNDVARTGAGDDYAVLGAGDDLIEAGDGDDRIEGQSIGADRVYGQNGDDRVNVGYTDDLAVDYVDGGAGDDLLTAVPSSSDWVGGPGTDTLSYYGNGNGVRAEIGTTTGNGFKLSDAIAGDIEVLIGTEKADTLIGSEDADVLIGAGGDDRIEGRGGNDTLDEDVDFAGGSLGNDDLIGGAGVDTVDYSRAISTAANENGSAFAVTAQLDGVRNDGAVGMGESDLIASDVEGVTGGPNADTLRAGSTPAVLEGRGGADTLQGGPESDTIYAQDAGADTISCGGGGNDVVRQDAADATAADCETASLLPHVRITGTVPAGGVTNQISPKFTWEAGAGPDVTFTCRVVRIGVSPLPPEVPCESGYRPDVSINGDYSLVVKAKLPTTTATSTARLFSVDTVAPDTTLASGGTGTVTTEQTTVSFAATESGVKYECALDGAKWRSCAATETFSGLTNGSHTVRARAKDVAGNIDATPLASTFTVAVPGPQTTLTQAPSSPNVSTSATFAFSATPASGSTFECKLDAGAWAACTSPRTVTGLAAGSHTFAVRGVNGGIADPTPASHTWTVDPTLAPDTTVVAPPSNYVNATVSFTMTSDQAGSTFECKLGSGAWTACTSPFSVAPPTSGTSVYVQIRAKNSLGIVDPDEWTRLYFFDLVAPETAITSGVGSGGTVADDQTEFAFSSTETPATFECRKDAGTWSTCESPFTWTSLAPGSHTFDVRARDRSGNIDGSPVSRSFTASAPPAPQTTWTDIAASGSRLGDLTPTLRFKANPARDARFECAAGPTTSATFVPCTSPWTVPDQVSGATTVFQVRAIGTTGLVDATPAQVTYTFDTSSALAVSPAVSFPVATSLTGSPASLDWIHWKSATPSIVDRRNVSPQRLSSFSLFAGGTPTTVSSPSSTFSWTDAVGTASGSSAVGVANGEAIGRGLSFTSTAANTETRTLRVYVGVKGGTVSTTGQLSVSFPADTTIAPVNGALVSATPGQIVDKAFDVTFRPRLATDSLRVQWLQTAGSGTGTAVVLYGATVR